MYPGLMLALDAPDTSDVEILRSWTPPPIIEKIPSLAIRAFQESLLTRQGSPTLIPGPINRLPPEIFSNVFVLAALSDLTPMSDDTTTSSAYFPMVLCHISSQWRQIAFSTPQLWENLSTRVVLFGTPHQISPSTLDLDKLLVKKKSIEFLTWWAANIKDNNAFALRIEIILEKSAEFHEAHGDEIITLGGTGHSTLLGLVCRARYLHLQGYAKSFPYLWRSPESASLVPAIYFPSMESLVFQGSSHSPFESNSDVDFPKLPFHLMPTLRKLRVGYPQLCDPLGLRISRPEIRISLKNMWGRLTHLHLGIKTTPVGWNTFIGTCITLESAHIRVMFSTPLNDNSSSRPGVGMQKLPNLRELCLDVFDICETHTDVNIFQDLHFPKLKTLMFGTRVLSRRHFHLLVQAAPSLERLHISIFTETGQLIWGSRDISEGHLNEYVPSLRQLLIEIPPIDGYKGSLAVHVESMVHSGWFQGPWKKGPLCIELICLPQWDNGALDIRQFKQLWAHKWKSMKMWIFQ